MKILTAGLGIIGGSICLALKRAGHSVDGMNRSPGHAEYALNNGIIDAIAESPAGYDTIIIALPPKATVDFINSARFADGAVVADICGVKKYIRDEVLKKPRNFRYVGCHPMAGKEVSGIENACADLFDSASMVITSDETTDKDALERMRSLTADMGFKYIVECSAEVHDKKIAYTSQLAHIVSNAYVKDGGLDGCIGFTGGSFQDMTRIAGVDADVWSSLYLLNAENLSNNIGSLISSLSEIKDAVDRADGESLRKILQEGKQRFESGKIIAPQKNISVKKLK